MRYCPEVQDTSRNCPEVRDTSRNCPEVRDTLRNCPEVQDTSRNCPEVQDTSAANVSILRSRDTFSVGSVSLGYCCLLTFGRKLCSLSFPAQLPATLYQGLNTLGILLLHTSHIQTHLEELVTDLCILAHWDLQWHHLHLIRIAVSACVCVCVCACVCV